MSIRKFSDKVLFIAPYFSDYRELDTHEATIAKLTMEKVCKYFVQDLQFSDLTMFGDDSLNLECFNYLKHYGGVAKVVNTFPLIAYDFLENNVVSQDRMGLLKQGTYPNPSTFHNGLPIVEALSKHLLKPVDLKEKERAQKIEVILRVKMFDYLGIPLLEEDLFKKDKMFPSFYLTANTTREQLVDQIEENFDDEWMKACVALREVIVETDQDVEEDATLSSIYSLLKIDQPKKKKVDSVVVDIDKDKLQQLLSQYENKLSNPEETISEEISTIDRIDLSKRIRQVNAKTTSNYSVLVDEVMDVMDLLKSYRNEVIKKVVNSHTLIVDFHLSSTSDRSKIAPYDNTEKNTIILNVNLRTSLAEAYFKGGPLKLSAFSNNTTKFSPNVAEW